MNIFNVHTDLKIFLIVAHSIVKKNLYKKWVTLAVILNGTFSVIEVRCTNLKISYIPSKRFGNMLFVLELEMVCF